MAGTYPTLGELIICGIIFELYPIELTFFTEFVLPFCLNPSTDFGLYALFYCCSYLAPGRAPLRDFRFRGQNIVPNKLEQFLIFNSDFYNNDICFNTL